MTEDSPGIYLRTYRLRAGLSQNDVGTLLGYENETAVRRHERLKNLPPLVIAVGYEVIFKIPVTELFPGIKDTLEKIIEPRISQLEDNLQQKARSRGSSSRLEQKLAWISKRRKANNE